jgi:hypothetical protein
VTIGGGGASKNSRQGVQTVSRITANMTFDNESEERIVSGTHDINLQSLQSPEKTSSNGIMVSKKVSVTTVELDCESSVGFVRHR